MKIQELFETVTNTSQFKRWFGNSKVVDNHGGPLVVYHGTPATVGDDFAFDISRLGTRGRSEGAGFYFTTNKDVADAYGENGEVVGAYLSIQKPLHLDAPQFNRATMTKILDTIEKLEAKTEGLNIGEGYLSNYGDVASEGYNLVLNRAVDVAMGDEKAVDQFNSLIGAGVSADIVNRGMILATGHDGIIANGYQGDHADAQFNFIVFTAEQIKSVRNRGNFDPSDHRIHA